MQEKRLGRGLEYLLDTSTKKLQESKKVSEIQISRIRKNRFQPRSSMDQDALNNLMQSIKENGLLQPILVKENGLNYEIIAGERRFQACKALGKETIEAITLDIPENRLLQLAIIENIQRENLNPIEEAKAFQAMLKLENITHEELATRMGKNRSTITNTLRLLELPEEVQSHVSRGTLTYGHARTLLSFKDQSEMLEALKKVLDEGLSVRELETLSKSETQKKKKVEKRKEDPHIKDLENKLMEKLGTKVEIRSNGDRGKISFYFYSDDDFKRLYDDMLY